jgi:hypothetical protein
MGDPIGRREHLWFAQADHPLGPTFAVVPLVNGERATYRGENRPPIGVRVLRVFRADGPQEYSRVQIRGLGRRHRHLKLTLENPRRDGEVFRNATGAEIIG